MTIESFGVPGARFVRCHAGKITYLAIRSVVVLSV